MYEFQGFLNSFAGFILNKKQCEMVQLAAKTSHKMCDKWDMDQRDLSEQRGKN